MESCLKRVKKEIHLENLELNFDELSRVIKASSQCERLIIRYSKINSTGTLDFDNADGYKLQFISFITC